jgi:hypothetical protein
MAALRFLDLPTIVRDQIYTELLVPPVIKHEDGCITQDPACIEILFVNREIYAEASDIFYSKNLFTVISSNSKSKVGVFEDLNRDKLRIMYDVKDATKIAQCNRFAMSMEILILNRLYKATSTPFYVLPAAILPYFAGFIITGTGAVRMKVEHTFRYTISRFSELVFGRFLTAERLPKFRALRIEGLIEPSYRHSMIQNCVQQTIYDAHELGCAHYENGINSIGNHVYRRIHEEKGASNVATLISESQTHELPRLMLRMYDIFWDYHTYLEREFGHSCGAVKLFFRTIGRTIFLLVDSYLFAADRDPEKSVDIHIQALSAAEEGLKYLNRDDRLIFPQMVDDSFGQEGGVGSSFNVINGTKAKLSRKAAEVCIRLGYVMEADQYMIDSITYEPNKYAPTLDMTMVSNRT